jgi:hypothetical protein
MFKVNFAGALITGTFALGLMSTTALSADIDDGCTPAVSGLNGKIEGSGGYLEDDDADGGRFHGVATLSLPLGCLIGAQIDLAGGDLDGDGFFGAGGHLFIRDPASYLVGIHGQYIDLDGDDIFRIGPEFEIYLDQFTISGVLGFEGVDDFDTDDVVGGIEASYYITDNFKVGAGYRHYIDLDVGALTMEFQPENFPLSIFADAMAGSDDFVSVSGGFRFYFGGEDKSLIRRHREDDPAHLFNWLRKTEDNPSAPAPCVDDPETRINECTGEGGDDGTVDTATSDLLE